MNKVILIAVILLAGCNDNSASGDKTNTTEDVIKSSKQKIKKPETKPIEKPTKKAQEKVSINWVDTGAYQVSGHLIKDTKTNLIWMRCAQGQQWNGSTCQGAATKFSWEISIKNSQDFSDVSGFSDWRLPTTEELKTLILCSNGNTPDFSGNDYVCGSGFDEPVISLGTFPNTVKYWHWTSTEKLSTWAESKNKNKKDMAVVVDFTDGGDGDFDKHNFYHSRLVRNN